MAKAQKPEWFSIKEAAEYLDIGEPTLYRWMRDRKITYRKVGDSTRFLQEDLDAMVQVHPSERQADVVHEFCPYCHHGELVEGRMSSTGRLYFYPERTRFLTWHTSEVHTPARMCTRCGGITTLGDLQKLRSLAPDQRAESEE